MKISAGLVIIHNNKILLVHPTNAPWYGSYSIPKGQQEKGEDMIDTALRETKEEIGVKFDRKQLYNQIPNIFDYTSKTGKVYKKVYYYLVYLNEKIKSEQFKLQLEEVDWVGFLSKEEASKRIFKRFKPLLNYLS